MQDIYLWTDSLSSSSTCVSGERRMKAKANSSHLFISWFRNLVYKELLQAFQSKSCSHGSRWKTLLLTWIGNESCFSYFYKFYKMFAFISGISLSEKNNKKVFHFCHAFQLKSSKCFRTCADLASQHHFNSGNTHFSVIDGRVREATWHSQAKSVRAPISSCGTVPTMLFFSLAIMGCYLQAACFSSSMSTWNSWIKCLNRK